MADTHESGMQIVTRRIELANKAMESVRALEMLKSELPYRILSSGTSLSSLGAFVDCLSSVSKSVFEHDKDRYLTTTLFTFLLQRPPTQPILFRMTDYLPDELAARELITSEFHTRKFVGLLGLISLHDACMSLPPLPRHEFDAEDRFDDVATLLHYLDIRGPDLVQLLLNLLIEGNIYDKLISVMALGAIPQQSGEVKHLVKAGIMKVFSEILKQGPMVLQAEVAHVISKFVAIDQTIHDELPLYDLIGSLVNHLQFMAAEENFQDNINTTTASAFSVAAASRTSNSRKIADDGKEKIADDGKEKSPEVKARMVATVNKTLRILVKNDSSFCWTIIEGLKDVAFSLRCLGIDEAILTTEGQAQVPLLLNTLRGGSLYDKCISVMALGAIAQQSGKVECLVEAGVVVEFTNILKEGPMLLQAEVAHVMSKCVAIDPAFRDKLPLHDLVVSLVSCLQVMADEDHFQNDINKTVSFFSIGAASRNSNGRKIVNIVNKKLPEVKARMLPTVTRTVKILVKNDPSLCCIVAKGLNDVALTMRCLDLDEVNLTTEGQAQISLLLNILKGGGSLYDKSISVIAIGKIAQQTRNVEHLVAAGVAVVFSKILTEGPMLLQAEVAHVMSKCLEIDPTFCSKLPLDDLIASIVSLLQVEVAEEHLQDDINKATSVLSIVAARHNSNKRKVADAENEKSISGKQNKLQEEDSPPVKAKMRVMAAKFLGSLSKDNAPACHIIVEKRALLRLAVLLQNERLDVKLSSAMALMEITAVAEKESDLRRSAFKHNSYAHKTIVDQLIRIMKSSSTAELLIPCIKAVGNLAATFRGTQPIISLVHQLESSNSEVVKETLVALTKFACRDHSFLHLDHSKAIVSLGGLNSIFHLAEHEDIGVEKQALVLLCYVAIDALGNKSDELKKVVSTINIASRQGHFSKDEAGKALLQQTKRRLSQLMLA